MKSSWTLKKGVRYDVVIHVKDGAVVSSVTYNGVPLERT